MLVIVGADEWGNKDILGLVDGYRESAQSWRELLVDLKRRGLERNHSERGCNLHFDQIELNRVEFGTTKSVPRWVLQGG